jgi:hypothetical protein
LEKAIVVYTPEVEIYLEDLVDLLFYEEYFGFEDAAQNYAEKIVDFVQESIQNFPSRKTPAELKNFGTNYIFYKSNQRTTWYIFFEKSANNFLITNIINSHSEEAKWI